MTVDDFDDDDLDLSAPTPWVWLVDGLVAADDDPRIAAMSVIPVRREVEFVPWVAQGVWGLVFGTRWGSWNNAHQRAARMVMDHHGIPRTDGFLSETDFVGLPAAALDALDADARRVLAAMDAAVAVDRTLDDDDDRVDALVAVARAALSAPR